MKIIFSQDFITDSSRKDCYLVMSKYFLAKVSGSGKAFNSWDDLVSQETLEGFIDGTNRTRTRDINVEGLWESDTEILKLHIKIPEGEGFNINDRVMNYSLGYFYYKTQEENAKEKIAFVLIPDGATLNEFGTLSVHESDTLDLVLGSNLLNIPKLDSLKCGIRCVGEIEDTEFLEGHGSIRGVNIWGFPESSGLIYASSAKSYILSGLREDWFGADLYPDPNGLTGENITTLKIPTSIYLNNTTSELVVGGLGGVVKVTGTYDWEEYSITSTKSEIISTGTSDISELTNGEIIVSGAPEGMINSTDWRNKSVVIDPCPQKDILRTASISVSVPTLTDSLSRSFRNNKILTSIVSSPKVIEQENSTSVWEITIPIQGYTENDIPVVRLDWATLKGISGRTNKDFVIVTEKGQEPKEGNWIRVDCDWDGWKEYIDLVIDKYNHSDLWWDLKISISPILDKIIETLPDTPPTCYVVLGGSDVREFILEFPESLFPGMPQPTYLKTENNIEIETGKVEEEIKLSGTELMEIDEVEILPTDSKISLYLDLPVESLVTIYTPSYSPIEVVFQHGESNTVQIPPIGKIELPVLIKDAETDLDKNIEGRIEVTDLKTGEKKKELKLLIKKGRAGIKRKKKKPVNPKTTSSPLYFHSQGMSLTGYWKYGSENIIATGFRGDIDLNKTTLRIKLGEKGYIPVLDFGWIREQGGTYTLLARLPQNSTDQIIGEDINAWLDLWDWETKKSLWSCKIYQGTTCVKFDPDPSEVLEMSGAKNSIFPERRYWTIQTIQKEYNKEGGLEERENLPVELENVVWKGSTGYLKGEAELKLFPDGIAQPLFNVDPTKYKEEFKINITGSCKVKLPGEENLGLVYTGPIPFSLWINKPKLNDE